MNQKHAIQALLFDLGNVIVEIDLDAAFRTWSAQSGLPAPELKLDFDLDRAYLEYETGHISTAQFFQRLQRELGIGLDPDQLAQGWNAILLQPVSGIETLLRQAARRWPLFAFSNTNEAHQQCWENMLGDCLKYFSDVYVSWRMGRRKPDREAFEQVAVSINLSPRHILFFDDLEENVVAARMSGFQAVHCASISDIQDALAEM